MRQNDVYTNSRSVPLALLACLIGTAWLQASCHGISRPELADISRVTPDVVEEGAVLRIEGNGFIEGPAEVAFEGELRVSGAALPVRHKVLLDGVAIGENTVEIPVTGSAMKRLADEPSRFFGRVTVTFHVPHGSLRILAVKENVAIEFSPGGGGVAMAAKRERAASRFLNALGIRLIDPVEADGIVVAQVVPGSAAARAGLAFGDRLLAIDGTPIKEPADLAGGLMERSHQFNVVSRFGAIREVRLGVQQGPYLDRDELTAMILASVAFGLFWALVAPERRRQYLFSPKPEDHLLRAMGFTLISLYIVAVLAMAILFPGNYSLLVMLFVCHVLGIVTLLPFMKSRIRWFSLLLGTLIVPTIFIIAGFLSSAIGLREIVESQASTIYGPHAWSNPFTLLATVLAIALLWPIGVAHTASKHISSAAQWSVAVPVSAAISACLLGGWTVPFISADVISNSGWLLALGGLLYLIKTWLVLLAAKYLCDLWHVSRRTSDQALRPRLIFPLFMLSAVLAVAFEAYELKETARIVGQLLATAMFVTFTTTFMTLGVKSMVAIRMAPENNRRPQLAQPPAQP